ncbi:MAG: hypothetical protein ACE365_07070 [Gammaproteobacteria bacterium]
MKFVKYIQSIMTPEVLLGLSPAVFASNEIESNNWAFFAKPILNPQKTLNFSL